MVEVFLAVGDLVMIGAVIGAVVFAVSYAAFFNWRKTPAGRALMYFVLALMAVFVNNTIARLAGPEYPFREWVRLAVYTAVAFTIWRLVYVLWRNWRSDKPPLDLDQKSRRPRNPEE